MINCFLNFVPLLPHEQLTPPEFRLGDGLGADEQLLFRSLRRLTGWLLLVFLWLASNDVLFGLSTDGAAIFVEVIGACGVFFQVLLSLKVACAPDKQTLRDLSNYRVFINFMMLVRISQAYGELSVLRLECKFTDDAYAQSFGGNATAAPPRATTCSALYRLALIISVMVFMGITMVQQALVSRVEYLWLPQALAAIARGVAPAPKAKTRKTRAPRQTAGAARAPAAAAVLQVDMEMAMAPIAEAPAAAAASEEVETARSVDRQNDRAEAAAPAPAQEGERV